MITAVDTNVLFDVLIPGSAQGEASEQALTEAARAGALVLCEPVYAELAAFFRSQAELDGFLVNTGIRLDRVTTETLDQSGRAWRAYRDRRPPHLVCPQCGRGQTVRCEACGRNIATRQQVLADFIIGAHALRQADRLLTRDRGYYTTYFPGLALGP